MVAIGKKQLTVDEFWEQYAQGTARVELVKGIPVEMSGPKTRHAVVAAYLSRFLVAHVMDYALGVVLLEGSFYLSEDDLRRPDLAFVAKPDSEGLDLDNYVPFAPTLAVEIISPNDAATMVHDKAQAYRQAGTLLIWIIYPASKMLVVHYPDGSAQTLTVEDTLRGGDILPGFELPLERIFPA